jgi:maleamate amidohydrolase
LNHYLAKEWVQRLPEEERNRYEKIGLRGTQSMGKRPALLIIDCTLGFTGSKPQPVEQAALEYPTACGQTAWDAMQSISQAASRFRELQLPVIYTVMDLAQEEYAGGATKWKGNNFQSMPGYNDFAEPIRPMAGDWVMPKTKASVFFQTPLLPYLIKQNVDSLVVCGGSTSGCVRASAVDGLSNGFTCFVMEDGCFDRSRFAHNNNLFDLDAKYASVQTWQELKPSLDNLIV